MEKIRQTLKNINMKYVAKESGISYQVLKNFSSGRKKYLTPEEANAVITVINNIPGGLK